MASCATDSGHVFFEGRVGVSGGELLLTVFHTLYVNGFHVAAAVPYPHSTRSVLHRSLFDKTKHPAQDGALWEGFETKVIDCCNRVMRPYGVASPAISSRMLSVHGRGATMPTSTMMGVERRAIQFVRTRIKNQTRAQNQVQVRDQPVVAVSRRSVPHEMWARASETERARLVQKYVLSTPKPFFSTSLPERIAETQKKGCKGSRRPAVHVCKKCRCAYLVAFHVPGLRIEALGNVIAGTWHCPACSDAPVLAKIDLVGQLVHATNGIFAACRVCAAPLLFLNDGLCCADCEAQEVRRRKHTIAIRSHNCWNACKRVPVQEIMTIPADGIDDGQPWPRIYACHVHSIPDDVACRPVKYEHIRRIWWRSRNGQPIGR